MPIKHDQHPEDPQYQRPEVTDLGTFVELTAMPGKSFGEPDNTMGIAITNS